MLAMVSTLLLSKPTGAWLREHESLPQTSGWHAKDQPYGAQRGELAVPKARAALLSICVSALGSAPLALANSSSRTWIAPLMRSMVVRKSLAWPSISANFFCPASNSAFNSFNLFVSCSCILLGGRPGDLILLFEECSGHGNFRFVCTTNI